MSGAELSSVAYKKGNWMRYTLWVLGAICVGLLIVTFMNMMSDSISSSVPAGYKFAVSNNYGEGSKIRKTYYVYDDNKILVESESFGDESVDRAVMVYDGINTKDLVYDSEDLVEICEVGNCVERPRILVTIRKLLANKVGREYIGF